ncbi:MAG: hypothetical protein JXA72_08495 [Bacteroidales bacterium]|nr:hypothetical protein [Bacteroidales bacterium]
MRKAILSSILGCFLFAGVFAQDCPMYYPDMVNAQLEYKQYDKKGNLSGSSVQKIVDIKKSAGSTEMVISAESFDAKGKSLGSADLKARCEGGVYYIDMKSLMSPQTLESYKDMEMKMEGGNLELPASMKAGDVLKSGDMKISFIANGMTILNMTVNVSNRKVEAVESITTPAGTFDCYKISYDVATKMMVNVKTKGVEWFSDGIGMVKSETYDSAGKLLGSNVLTSVKK